MIFADYKPIMLIISNDAIVCWYPTCNNLMCSFLIIISVNGCLGGSTEYLFWKCTDAFRNLPSTLIIPSSSKNTHKYTKVICWILVMACLFLDTITSLKRLSSEMFFSILWTYVNSAVVKFPSSLIFEYLLCVFICNFLMNFIQ